MDLPSSKGLFPNSISQNGFRVHLERYSGTNQRDLWNLIASDRKAEDRRGIWPGINSFDLLVEYMEACDFTSTHSPEYGYLIYLSGFGPIGTFHIQSVSWQDMCCEVGYWIHHASTGKGYASESLRLVENSLREMGFSKVSIETTSLNIPSWSIAEKAGFALVKELPKTNQPSDQNRNDSFRIYEKILS